MKPLIKRLRNSGPVASAAAFIQSRLSVGVAGVPCVTNMTGKSPAAAFICDEMTWLNYGGECDAVFVTPGGWREAFEQNNPALFFCESAWAGIDGAKNCWRGQIYRDRRVWFDNRRALLDILDHCRENNISTVFWNKEDPLFFNDKIYDFTDTALRFDRILTTAAECVTRYEELGAKRVSIWRFGFPEAVFYPPEAEGRENIAVFAGSWNGDQEERRRELERLLNFVIAAGISPVIYDRHSEDRRRRFPSKYAPYIRKAVPYRELGEIYRRASYVLNVNTVSNSETMFSRRVYEAMACGCIVISSPAAGLELEFPGRIWIPGRPFDASNIPKIREENIHHVFEFHTCNKRWAELMLK